MASPPDSDDEPQGQLDMGDMMKMILEVQKKVSDLEKGVKSRDDEISDLKKGMKNRDDEISDLKKDVKNRDDEIAELKKQVQDVQQKQDPTMDKFANEIKGLSEDQKKGEEGKTILKSMCDYVYKHPYLVVGAATVGICAGLFALCGVACTFSVSALYCLGAGSTVLLVGDLAAQELSKEKTL